MRLISRITIDRFRSIADTKLENCGHFTALAGLNNSGKSNILRALNAFFSGYTDQGRRVTIEDDYHRQYFKRKKAKRIRVSVAFQLPDQFTFRKDLKPVQDYLGGKEFEISKEWTRGSVGVEYFLNNQGPLEPNERGKIDQFLGLISFRYIPNRVLPLDVIRNEHQSLRDVLVRRLARKAKNQADAFKALRDTSSVLVKAVAAHVHDACPDVGDVRLATPASWQEMIFAFGYKLITGDIEVDDVAQGSGVQSLLMLQTLSLIDRDYFQKFGWKQAAVWALEEPESSLHSSLEATVANYLSELSRDVSSRLQIITTTHSDLVLQYSDMPVFVSQTDRDGTKIEKAENRRSVLERAAKFGISRWVHPILADPLNPIILVEGKYDEAFISSAIAVIEPGSRVHVRYLEQLVDGGGTGGVDDLLRYVKANSNAIRMRVANAPVVVVLDWDSEAQRNNFAQLFKPEDPFRVLVWPLTSFNPLLGASFKGIERSMSERLIREADQQLGIVAQKTDGTLVVTPQEYPKLKERIYRIVTRNIAEQDLTFARPFIEEIIRTAKSEFLQQNHLGLG